MRIAAVVTVMLLAACGSTGTAPTAAGPSAAATPAGTAPNATTRRRSAERHACDSGGVSVHAGTDGLHGRRDAGTDLDGQPRADANSGRSAATSTSNR